MSDNTQQIRSKLEIRSTRELTSILRNRNDDEWRPEVFEIVASILASRGLSPVEISALGPEGGDVLESQPLITIGNYLTSFEAQTDRMALEAAGIPAWVTDEMAGTMYPNGARLQVRVGDEAAALALLDR
jgi:hypothetical protein